VSERLPEGEWLTLPEAAERLGLSVITLRRRLKEGGLEGKQVPSKHGPQWLVRLEADAKPAPTLVAGTVEEGDNGYQGEATQGDKGGQELVNLELVRLVEKLQEENRALAEAAAAWQGRAEVLSLQLSHSQERVLALEAPKIEPKVEEAKPWWKAIWEKLY